MRVEGPDKNGMCWPKCTWFKCEKKVLKHMGKVLWCEWLEQPCIGASCAYASCMRNKLLSGNKCGLVIKRITKDVVRPEDFKVNVKLRGKLANILDDDDLV